MMRVDCQLLGAASYLATSCGCLTHLQQAALWAPHSPGATMRSTAVAVAVAVACFLTCLEAQDPVYNQLLPYDTTFASPGA